VVELGQLGGDLVHLRGVIDRAAHEQHARAAVGRQRPAAGRSQVTLDEAGGVRNNEKQDQPDPPHEDHEREQAACGQPD
jgi:hypothetical protein